MDQHQFKNIWSKVPGGGCLGLELRPRLFCANPLNRQLSLDLGVALGPLVPSSHVSIQLLDLLLLIRPTEDSPLGRHEPHDVADNVARDTLVDGV